MTDGNTTLREWSKQFTDRKDEVIDFIVLDWERDWGNDDWPEWDQWGKSIPFIEVPSTILDHPFYPGFGGNNSPNLCAWSANWVLFSDNYDGAEGICWVPRNPLDHAPTRPGGG